MRYSNAYAAGIAGGKQPKLEPYNFWIFEGGKWEEAIADYDRGLALDSHDGMAYNNRGNAKAGLGRWSEAIADYRQAADLAPNFAFARANLALDDNTFASDPGRIRLEPAKLRRFHPELYEPQKSGIFGISKTFSSEQQYWPTHIQEHLIHGDSRAAIVVSGDRL